MITTLWYSLLSYNPSLPAYTKFVGLANYVNILFSDSFWGAIWRSVYFTVLAVTLEVVCGLAVALLLNEEFNGRGLLRTLVIAPWALAPVVCGLMWRWILDAKWGALNGLLYQLGLISSYVVWLEYPFVVLNISIIIHVWEMSPLAIILLLAGLQSVPNDLYEAAKVDGASSWRRFRHLTLPLLEPTLAIVVIIGSITAFQVFDILYVLAFQNPGVRTVAFETYFTAFRNLDFGSASALTYFMTAVLTVLAYLYTRRIYKGDTH
jgi:multiple sugar transport system permease protein/N,N'-diacetylchitobiose transport system permease protein